MTPETFIKTWTENDLTERAGAQAFIEDLCEPYTSTSRAVPLIFATKKVR